MSVFLLDSTNNVSRVDASVESELDHPERGTNKFGIVLEQCTGFVEEENDELGGAEIANLLKTSKEACLFRLKDKKDNFLDVDDIFGESVG